MLVNEIEQLKQHIESKMNHKYVDIYVQRPGIDQLALELLYYASEDIKLKEKDSRAYMTATILVQTALNAHELVRNEEDYLLTDKQKKEKQLLVLAGDYYSGLYYLLLSEIKDVQMVECLAKGIQEVNERKMQLYYSEFNTMEELVQLLLDIHTIIITRVSKHLFKASEATAISKVVRLDFLLQELNQNKSMIHMYIKDHSKHATEVFHQILDTYIEQHVHEIEEHLSVNESVPSSLEQVLQHFLNNEVYDISTTAEEG